MVAAGTAATVAVLTADAAEVGSPLALAVVVALTWTFSIGIAGGYQARFLGVGSEEYHRVALGALGLIAVVGTGAFAFDLPVARSVVLVELPLAFLLTLVSRKGLRVAVGSLRKRGRLQRNTIVLGDPEGIATLTQHLSKQTSHGYRVVGACVVDSVDEPVDVEGVTVHGDASQVADAVRMTGADTVAVAGNVPLSPESIRRVSWDLEPLGANIVIAPSLMDVAGPRIAVRPVEGLPLLHVEQPTLRGLKRLIKETYDPIVATLGLILLSPFLFAIAVAIKIDSPGPAFFRQTRIGRRGKPFTIVKFRTMSVDAEARKADLAHLNEGAGPLFKMKSDPRITRVGSFLRKTSLDELPQLFNVVTGNMSLVGPRPHLPEEIELFGDDFRRRLLVKPGLTGLWQVSGRSDLTFDESVRVDLHYVENWSLALDSVILAKTVTTVVKGSGAY